MLQRLTVVLLLAGTAAAAQPTDPVWKTFNARLHQFCGPKKLDLLSPAELLDVVESFTANLPPEQQHMAKNYEDQACANSPAGAACQNTGFLQAAAHANLLDRFAAQVCVLPKKCSRQSECIEVEEQP